MSTVGYATLPIIPSLRGMENQVRRQLGGLTGMSETVGRQSGSGFISQFGSNLSSGLTGIGDTVTRWARRGFLAAGATAGAVIATGLWGGLQRALDREDAIVTFRRMGLDDRNIIQLTDSIDQALQGTPISNPEGFALAGRFLAQGFDQADIPGIVSTIADVSAVGNRSFSEMADVLVSAAGQGRITAAELNRLGDVPLGRVAEQLGLTEQGLRNLVSEGGLTAEVFLEAFAAVEEFSGAARDATTRVAWSNLKTQIASIGEQFLGPLLGEGGAAGQALLSLRESIGALGPAAQDLGQRFADWLIPAVQRASDWFSDVFVPALRDVRDFMNENREVIGRVAAAVGPAVAIVGALATSITLVSTALRILGLTTPVGIIMALVAGLVYAWQNSETFRNVVTSAWEAIVAVVGPAVEAVVGWISDLAGWFSSLGDGGVTLSDRMSAAWEAMRDAVRPVVKWFQEHVGPVIQSVAELAVEWWGLVSSAFSTLMGQIRTVWSVIGEPTMRVMEGAWEQLKTVAEFVWEAIRIVVETTLGVVKGIIDTVTALIRGDWEGVWDAIGGIASTVWDGIKRTVENAIGFVASTIDTVLETIHGFWTSVWDTISGFLSDKWDDMKSTVSGALDDVVGWMRDLPGRILSALGDLGSILLDAGRQIIGGLLDGFRERWENARDWLSNLGGEIRDLKGPIDKDRVLLTDIGEAVIGGFDRGLRSGWRDVERTLAGMTAEIPVRMNRNLHSGTSSRDRQVADQHFHLEIDGREVAEIVLDRTGLMSIRQTARAS